MDTELDDIDIPGRFLRELSEEMSQHTKRGMALKAAQGGINGLAALGYANRRR